MAVKLFVGYQQKIGLPDYGSLGASCHVEFEIDRSLLEQDLQAFHHKVNEAFVACRQAVSDQLAKARGSAVTATKQPIRSTLKSSPTGTRESGSPEKRSGANGHAGPPSGQEPPEENAHAEHHGSRATNSDGSRHEAGTITQSQLRAILAISRRHGIDPLVLVQERFEVDRLEALSIREASCLIDELKRGPVEVRS